MCGAFQLTYVEDIIMSPFLYHTNVGKGSPIASQSIVPFPLMSMVNFAGGGWFPFHCGATKQKGITNK